MGVPCGSKRATRTPTRLSLSLTWRADVSCYDCNLLQVQHLVESVLKFWFIWRANSAKLSGRNATPTGSSIVVHDATSLTGKRTRTRLGRFHPFQDGAKNCSADS